MFLRRFGSLFLLLVGLLDLSACSMIGTETPIFRSEVSDSSGIVYYMPKTLLTIALAPYGKKAQPKKEEPRDIAGDVIRYISISDIKPETGPDLRQSYTLSYSPSVFATDNICAGVDNGLLMAVEAASEDETGNIIVSIAKLAGRIASLMLSDQIQRDRSHPGAPRTPCRVRRPRGRPRDHRRYGANVYRERQALTHACNPGIAQAIVDHGADYLLAVKANQPSLLSEMEQFFNDTNETAVDRHTDVDKGHRVRSRKARLVPHRRAPLLGEYGHRLDGRRTPLSRRIPLSQTRRHRHDREQG